MDEDYGNVEVGDSTPPIKEQAKSQGWECDYFSFGKAEMPGTDWFNPGVVRRPDGTWLLVRKSQARQGLPFGHNEIVAIKLEGKMTTAGVVLKFPNSGPEEQFEDPRAVYWNGQTWVSCVNFTWYLNGSWTGAHQMLGIFKDKSVSGITEESWSALARRDPVVGTNRGSAGPTQGKHNKNLTYFFLRDTLHCVYTSDPWNVVQFGATWKEQISHEAEGVIWSYGTIRGGTPPVLVGDKFYTFFHSSMPWRGRFRRYYMGAMAFQGEAPFRPLLWTQKPILIGSQNDFWRQRKPLVVFPCGALLEEDGKWFITLGVNDLKSAWLEMPHSDLLKLLSAPPDVPGISLFSDPTPKLEYEAIQYQPGDEDSEESLGPLPNVEMQGKTEEKSFTELMAEKQDLSVGGQALGPSTDSSDSAQVKEQVQTVSSDTDAQTIPTKRRGRPRGSKNKKHRKKKKIESKAVTA